MSPTPKDQVSMMFGRIVADELDELGLLASDKPAQTDHVPTLWRVKVTNNGKKSWQHSGLASEFQHVAGRGGMAIKSWTNETTARRQARMAKNRGLDVVITPCATIELQSEVL